VVVIVNILLGVVTDQPISDHLVLLCGRRLFVFPVGVVKDLTILES
jgi:hypothetical protein